MFFEIKSNVSRRILKDQRNKDNFKKSCKNFKIVDGQKGKKGGKVACDM